MRSRFKFHFDHGNPMVVIAPVKPCLQYLRYFENSIKVAINHGLMAQNTQSTPVSWAITAHGPSEDTTSFERSRISPRLSWAFCVHVTSEAELYR